MSKLLCLKRERVLIKSPLQEGFFKTGLAVRCCQRLINIGDDIVDMLNAD